MSEEAWERETDPHKLIQLVAKHFVISGRKLRHFVCDSVRYLHPTAVEKADADALAFAERIADEQATIDPDEWCAAYQALEESPRNQLGETLGRSGLFMLALGEDVYDDAHWTIEYLKDAGIGAGVPTGFLREIFGNLFRPIDFTPWRTGTAVALARQMYDSRDFGAMPILADALQDAGCDNTDVLNHCRDANQTHVRGCWVVDGVLGKE